VFRNIQAHFLAALIVAAAGTAHAQTGPDASIDARFRAQTVDPLGPSSAAEALATGQGDLILLRRARLVTLEANLNATDTDNAFLTGPDEQRDRFATVDLSATGRLQLGERTAATLRLGATAAQYEHFDELNYAAATATLAVQSRRLGLDWTAYYQRAEIFDEGFSDRTLTQDRLRVEVGRSATWRDLNVSASAYAEHVIANPEDYKNSAGGLELSASHPVPRLPQVTAFAQAGYERREYDSFFEGILGVARHDDTTSAGVGAAWAVTRHLQLVAGYNYRKNRSTSDVNRYEAGSVFIGAAARLRV
jgi:opacity protein-like surface antigen